MVFIKEKDKHSGEKTEGLKASMESAHESFLGKSIKIKGNISSEESIRIEGRVNGNIKSKKAIIIGESGNINGKLEADSINLSGKAKGDIISRIRLTIHRTAKFEGNIHSDNIIIEEGGIFNGNMNLPEKKNK